MATVMRCEIDSKTPDLASAVSNQIARGLNTMLAQLFFSVRNAVNIGCLEILFEDAMDQKTASSVAEDLHDAVKVDERRFEGGAHGCVRLEFQDIDRNDWIAEATADGPAAKKWVILIRAT